MYSMLFRYTLAVFTLMISPFMAAIFRAMAQADTAYRDNISAIDKYYVRNNQGEMLPMSTFVSYKIIESSPLISHFNLYRSTEFDGDAAKGYSSGQAIVGTS